MRCEGQKPCVVDGFSVLIVGHHDLHVVVETGGGQSLKMSEGSDMFADRGNEILRFNEADILAAGVAQDVTETINPAAPFAGKVDLITRVIHLGLDSGPGFETDHRLFIRLRSNGPQALLHNRVTAVESDTDQFFVKPDGCDVWVSTDEVS